MSNSVPVQTESARDAARKAIFKHRAPEKLVINFFGADIELRQPTLKDILSSADKADRESAVIETLIKHAYIPGTDEHVFEEADADSLRGMPFGDDFLRVNEALEKLTKVNFRDKNNT